MTSRAQGWEHDGLRFWYVDKGPAPAGPDAAPGAPGDAALPFVFQHGLGGDRRGPLELYAYQPHVRLLALDCRGHGKTRPLGPIEKLRFAAFAADIVALLDHLGVERCVAGGVSMGAGVALALALRYPSRVAGLLLVRPAWLAEPSPPNLDGMAAVGRLIGAHGVEEGRRLFLHSPLHRQLMQESPYTAAALLAQFDEPRAADSWPRLVHLPADAPNRDAAAWGGISAPTLVLGSQADPVHPFAYAEALAAAIPGARLAELPAKTLDAPAYTRAARAEIAAFLAAFSPPRRPAPSEPGA